VIFFGLLVHQTIEEIHRIALDGQLDSLDGPASASFSSGPSASCASATCGPLATRQKRRLTQVMNYFRQNRDEMQRVIQTEVDVSLEKDGYILAGKVDLLLGGDGKLELLDFKTSPRPKESPELIAAYERQLCTYAHILERRHGKRVERLMLYWTSEPRKEDALMVLPYDPQRSRRLAATSTKRCAASRRASSR
jgi:DNA helicase-2/ATP-dependent DNA helicase PcrA